MMLRALTAFILAFSIMGMVVACQEITGIGAGMFSPPSIRQ
jgi:hypothetical protein